MIILLITLFNISVDTLSYYIIPQHNNIPEDTNTRILEIYGDGYSQHTGLDISFIDEFCKHPFCGLFYIQVHKKPILVIKEYIKILKWKSELWHTEIDIVRKIKDKNKVEITYAPPETVYVYMATLTYANNPKKE